MNIEQAKNRRKEQARLKKEQGDAAERQAADFLQKEGFVLLDRNVRQGRHEIDIIAFETDILCFIEVRSRRGKGDFSAKHSVNATKQRSLILAAQKYLQNYCKNNPGPLPFCRFDVIAVEQANLELIRNAFTA